MGGIGSSVILLVVMFAFMYFGMMRPQKKQQQKRMEMLHSLKKGQKVVTIGGLHAVIDRIDEAKQTVDLDAEGVILTFNLSAVRNVETAAPAAAKPAATEDKAADEKATDDSQD